MPENQLPEPVANLITAIASVVKTPYGPGVNEDAFQQAAYALVGWDVSPDEVARFGPWWSEHGHYEGMPALKSLLTEIRNARNPSYRAKRPRPAGGQPYGYADDPMEGVVVFDATKDF